MSNLNKAIFKLNSPYIDLEQKLFFLQEFVDRNFKMSFDFQTNRFAITFPQSSESSIVEKLYSRIGNYIKTGILTLGTFSYPNKEEAELKLIELQQQLNQQFNIFVHNNPLIINKISEKIKQGELEFEKLFEKNQIDKPVEEDESIKSLSNPLFYNVHKDWKIEDYQLPRIMKLENSMLHVNAADVGLGKAQPLSSLILTPNGWRLMGELKVGDKVYAYDGSEVKITAIFPQGKKPICKVYTSDGSYTECCEEHLWFTQTIPELQYSKANNIQNGVKTLLSGSVKQLKDINPIEQHAIPTVLPIEFESKKVKIDPYLIGVMLGQSSYLPISNEIIGISKSIISNIKKINDPLYSFEINDIHSIWLNEEDYFNQELQNLQLHNKGMLQRFIPEIYQNGSIEQRVHLLQGFLDCNGKVDKKRKSIFSYCFSAKLAADIKNIVLSLGGICSIKEMDTVKHFPQHSYFEKLFSLKITLPYFGFLPFRLENKNNDFLSIKHVRTLRTITEVEKIGDKECQCIMIDHPSHLYITNDFIVTHNTSMGLIGVQNLQNKGLKEKTLFVVPNNALSNWYKESTLGDKNKPAIFVDSSDCYFVNLKKKDDKQLIEAQSPQYKKVFMTHEDFFRLRLKESTINTYLKYLEQHDSSYSAAISIENKKATRFRDRIQKLSSQSKTKLPIYFEDFGFDSIVIDEFHAYKNSKEVFGNLNAKYLSIPQTSAKGIDAQVKCWFIRQQNKFSIGKEDGVYGLSATPFTNSPLEYYSMLNLIVGEENLSNLVGLENSFDFLQASCEIDLDEDTAVDGNTQRINQFKGIKNLTILRKALFKIIDFLTHEQVKDNVTLPNKNEIFIESKLSNEEKEAIELYKKVYSLSKKVVFAKDENSLQEILNSREWNEVVLPTILEYKEEPVISASPFNFIRKMERLTIDDDLKEQGLTYYLSPIEENKDFLSKINDTIQTFNKKAYKEKRVRPSKNSKNFKEIINEEGVIEYEVQVECWLKDNIENPSVFLDSLDYKTQLELFNAFSKFCKVSFKYNSGKLTRFIEQLVKEHNQPNGVDNTEKKPPYSKQLVFLDQIGSHLKVQALIAEKLSLNFSEVAVLTGQTNNEPEEVLDIQNKYNDGIYRIVLANEKAEVAINLQNGTQAIHHLTYGWTPDSIHQRNGRAIRYGNLTSDVNVYFYHTIGSFDVYKHKLVDFKSDWISKITNINGEDYVPINTISQKQYEEMISQLGEDLDSLSKQIEFERKQKEIKNLVSKQKSLLSFMTSEKIRDLNRDNKLQFKDVIIEHLKTLSNLQLDLQKVMEKSSALTTQFNYVNEYFCSKTLSKIITELNQEELKDNEKFKNGEEINGFSLHKNVETIVDFIKSKNDSSCFVKLLDLLAEIENNIILTKFYQTILGENFKKQLDNFRKNSRQKQLISNQFQNHLKLLHSLCEIVDFDKFVDDLLYSKFRYYMKSSEYNAIKEQYKKVDTMILLNEYYQNFQELPEQLTIKTALKIYVEIIQRLFSLLFDKTKEEYLKIIFNNQEVKEKLLPERFIELADKGELLNIQQQYGGKNDYILINNKLNNQGQKVSDFIKVKCKITPINEFEKSFLHEAVNLPNISEDEIETYINKIYEAFTFQSQQPNLNETQFRIKFIEVYGEVLKKMDFSVFKINEELHNFDCICNLNIILDNLGHYSLYDFKKVIKEEDLKLQDFKIVNKKVYETMEKLTNLYNAYIYCYRQGQISQSRIKSFKQEILNQYPNLKFPNWKLNFLNLLGF